MRVIRNGSNGGFGYGNNLGAREVPGVCESGHSPRIAHLVFDPLFFVLQRLALALTREEEMQWAEELNWQTGTSDHG